MTALKWRSITCTVLLVSCSFLRADDTVRFPSPCHYELASLAWSPDGTRIAAGASTFAISELVVWDVLHETELYRYDQEAIEKEQSPFDEDGDALRLHSSGPPIVFSDDGTALRFVGEEGVYSWKLGSRGAERMFRVEKSRVETPSQYSGNAALSPNGRTAIVSVSSQFSAKKPRDVFGVDLTTGRTTVLGMLERNDPNLVSLSFMADSRQLVVGHAGQFDMLDLDVSLRRLSGSAPPDDRGVVNLGDTVSSILSHLRKCLVVEESRLRSNKVLVSGDDRFLVYQLTDPERFTVVNMQTGGKLWEKRLPGSGDYAFAISQNGNTIALQGQGTDIFILDTLTGEVLSSLHLGDHLFARALAYSRDSRKLAIATDDTVIVWKADCSGRDLEETRTD